MAGRRLICTTIVSIALALVAAPAALAADAPGAPGTKATWTPADKDGFGTSTTTQSKVWHTLAAASSTRSTTPTSAPRACATSSSWSPTARTWAERDERGDPPRRCSSPTGAASPTGRSTTEPGRCRITKTYADGPGPQHAAGRRPLRVADRPHARRSTSLHDPALGNDGDDDSGTSATAARCVASDAAARWRARSPPRPRFTPHVQRLPGHQRRLDRPARRLPHGLGVHGARRTATSSRPGQTALDRPARRQQASRSRSASAATRARAAPAARALAGAAGSAPSRAPTRTAGTATSAASSAAGDRAAPAATTYDVSVMVLAAHEDKTYRGAYIASPTMPWAWGTGLSNPSGAYHLVWSRDLYQIATGADRRRRHAPAPTARSTTCSSASRSPTARSRRTRRVDGTPHWGDLQLDEVALPIVLAWQLGRTDGALTWTHIKQAADFLVTSPRRRSPRRSAGRTRAATRPATIAAEIAGLVCAADIARAQRRRRVGAERYRRTADDWQKRVEGWTATTNGPYSTSPYYLRLTKDGEPERGHDVQRSATAARRVDQRKVVDPSFLELVRLGVKPARRRGRSATRSRSSTSSSAPATPSGATSGTASTSTATARQKDGSPWDIGFPANPTEDWANNSTIGRNWPIFGGERGRVRAAGRRRRGRPPSLAHMAAAGQRRLHAPRAGLGAGLRPRRAARASRPGEGTFSATPLAWSHAQFVRLAWSIEAGHPVEQPSIVAAATRVAEPDAGRARR